MTERYDETTYGLSSRDIIHRRAKMRLAQTLPAGQRSGCRLLWRPNIDDVEKERIAECRRAFTSSVGGPAKRRGELMRFSRSSERRNFGDREGGFDCWPNQGAARRGGVIITIR